MGMFILILLFVIPEIMWVYFGQTLSDQDCKNQEWHNPRKRRNKTK